MHASRDAKGLALRLGHHLPIYFVSVSNEGFRAHF